MAASAGITTIGFGTDISMGRSNRARRKLNLEGKTQGALE
jgi:hypothetical protein